MLENERISRIRNILSREKSVNVESLSKLYHVSAMTIRRDLEKITRSDERIRRCRGGAIVLEDVKTEDEFEGKLSLNISGKRKIALRAIEEISGDDVIYLDAGTTTFELAKLINHSSLRVTVITNDILIAKELVRDEIEVIVTGGSLQKSTWCMIGGIAEGAVKRFKPNVAFMGCTAIDEGFNVLTPTLEKTTMKPIITRSSVK
ncbi:MAG: DeoR/GlpR family DNA-binding transcription regulator, partial [Clostridia bacterium]|nr:DeoR/GlpR family DNA-binding transcription regulator [Clostridia bacterium]